MSRARARRLIGCPRPCAWRSAVSGCRSGAPRAPRSRSCALPAELDSCPRHPIQNTSSLHDHSTREAIPAGAVDTLKIIFPVSRRSEIPCRLPRASSQEPPHVRCPRLCSRSHGLLHSGTCSGARLPAPGSRQPTSHPPVQLNLPVFLVGAAHLRLQRAHVFASGWASRVGLAPSAPPARC